MEEIGARIRKARKELGLSQSALAGEQMTKGMLSQIENNQAMPSMKNLQFIAEKLGKPVSYFLQEDVYKEPFPSHLVINDVTNTIKKSKGNNAKLMAEQNLAELDGILEKYKVDKDSKVYGDILLQYGYSLSVLNQYGESDSRISEAISIYIQQHLYLEAAKATLKLGSGYLDRFQYEKCLEATNSANELYLNSLHTDNELESEILYLRAFAFSAIGDMEQAIELLKKSINNMKRLDCFYKPDEIYRLVAVFYLYYEKYDEFLFNINKARQYAELADNNEVLYRTDMNLSVYYNNIGNPQKALEHLTIYENNTEEKRFIYYTQTAKAYYMLGNYEKAYECISRLNYETFINHVFDYNHLWTGLVIEGMILHRLGKYEQGITSIKAGIEKLEVFAPSKFLANAYKSLSDVYSDMDDFENAYKELKKAEEMYKRV